MDMPAMGRTWDRARRISAAVTLALLVWPGSAAAYVGPGAGITVLGALWAVVAAVVLALAGVVLWPIRSLLRRRKRLARAQPPQSDPAPRG